MRIVALRSIPVKATRRKPHLNRPFGEGVFTKRQPYTTADLRWWAENSPTRHDGYNVVPQNPWDLRAEEASTQARIDKGLLL